MPAAPVEMLPTPLADVDAWQAQARAEAEAAAQAPPAVFPERDESQLRNCPIYGGSSTSRSPPGPLWTEEWVTIATISD